MIYSIIVLREFNIQLSQVFMKLSFNLHILDVSDKRKCFLQVSKCSVEFFLCCIYRSNAGKRSYFQFLIFECLENMAAAEEIVKCFIK